MKSYWLVASGFSLGLGVSSLIEMKKAVKPEDKKYYRNHAAFSFVGGAFLLFVGLKAFNK